MVTSLNVHHIIQGDQVYVDVKKDIHVGFVCLNMLNGLYDPQKVMKTEIPSLTILIKMPICIGE